MIALIAKLISSSFCSRCMHVYHVWLPVRAKFSSSVARPKLLFSFAANRRASVMLLCPRQASSQCVLTRLTPRSVFLPDIVIRFAQVAHPRRTFPSRSVAQRLIRNSTVLPSTSCLCASRELSSPARLFNVLQLGRTHIITL